MFKVFVAEDEPKILRNIIRKINHLDIGFSVTGSASNGEDAFFLVTETEPDVLVTDIVMPKFDGLTLIEKLRRSFPELVVIVVSGYDEFEYARKAVHLGVKEYLLKPVDEQSLEQTLLRIKESLAVRNREKAKETLYSFINLSTDREVAGTGQDRLSRYGMYLLCLGSLYDDITVLGTDLILMYQKVWKTIRLDEAFRFSRGADTDFWLLDEPFINRKLLVVKLPPVNPVAVTKIARSLHTLLIQQADGIPVTISYSERHATLHEAFGACKEIRRTLKKCLVPGVSRSFMVEDKPGDGSSYVPALIEVEKRFEVVLKNCKKEVVERELSCFIGECIKSGMPQSVFSRAVGAMMRLIERREPGSTHDAESAGREIETIFSRQFNPDLLAGELLSFFRGKIGCVEFPLTPEKTAALLEAYLREHYTEQITMELVSEKFGFDLSYLTQLYKRHKGITPGKHLINLRIEKAREMIADRKDLSIKDVGEIVGYPDQHYFSRIFKKYVGISPQEYRVFK